MVCKVCGAKLQEGSAICELCGSPVGDSEIKSDYDPFTENNNSSGQWQEQFDNNAVKYNSSEKTTDNSKMNISFNPKIFAIVAVAILVIAITAILLINIGKNKSFVNNNSDYSGTIISDSYYISDEAHLLSEEEYSYIAEKLEKTSEEVKNDLIVLTVKSTNGKSMQDYADDYYDDNNYGYGNNKSGMLLLIAVDDREWYISTSGDCIKIFSGCEFDELTESFINKLKKDDYFEAFKSFCNTSKEIIMEKASQIKQTISTYSVIKSDVTWYDAERYAKNDGGHLVCINDYNEFNKVCSLADEKNIKVFWVGANRNYGETWNNAKWEDGKEIEFSQWYSGEPSYNSEEGNEEEYLMVFKVDGTWYFNDAENDVTKYYKGRMGYIVEFETEE
ncbi:MAG: TPM domain-containing protein [Clostridia bacterium]|nr:TPM domain-containing protein [Clostridia bacterium]